MVVVPNMDRRRPFERRKFGKTKIYSLPMSNPSRKPMIPWRFHRLPHVVTCLEAQVLRCLSLDGTGMEAIVMGISGDLLWDSDNRFPYIPLVMVEMLAAGATEVTNTIW